MTIHDEFAIPVNYLSAVVNLVNACREEDVEISQFGTLNNGLYVKFENVPGDAVIHDFSYGRESGCFETFRMPWDYDDVSVHEPKKLAKLLGALKRGEDWEKIDNEVEDK